MTQEFPSQTQGRTKPTALDIPNRLRCLNLLLCHLILILAIFPLASAPLNASRDLCPVWGPRAGQPLAPWKKFSRCHRDEEGAGAQHIWKEAERKAFVQYGDKKGKDSFRCLQFPWGGGTERKEPDSSQRCRGKAPKTLARDQRIPFFPRRMLDPGRET